MSNNPPSRSASRAPRLAAAAALIGGWLAVAALTWPGSAAHLPPTSAPPADLPVLKLPDAAAPPLAVGPITFFNTSCAPCHGDYGMLLREQLSGPDAQPAEVRRIIRDMVTGQARTNLPDRELDALAAYRLSLLGPDPFLAWTGADGGELRGEVTPGAAVELLLGPDATPATVTGHSWAAPAPTAAEGPITIRATLRGRSTLLPIPAAAFSPALHP